MNINIKPLNAALGRGTVALASDTHGNRLANILISPGAGPRSGQLGATCDCQEHSHPCSHLSALQQLDGYQHVQDLKEMKVIKGQKPMSNNEKTVRHAVELWKSSAEIQAIAAIKPESWTATCEQIDAAYRHATRYDWARWAKDFATEPLKIFVVGIVREGQHYINAQ